MIKGDRNVFIDNVDYENALQMYFKELELSPTYEHVKTSKSLNRKTKDIVFAKLSSPHYNSAAMDGIAVKSSVTANASESNVLTLTINDDFIYVNTGNIITWPYDAVIMIEDIIPIDDWHVNIVKAVAPWQHIRLLGEDIVVGEMILPSGHIIRPVDIGAMLASGVTEVQVYKKPVVGIVPTGSEIVSIDNINDIKKGEIIDSNSSMLEALVQECGGIAITNLPTSDNFELLKEKILEMAECSDIVIINAGSSTGSKDFTVHIIEEIGKVVVHGVAIKPGKPTILGIINNKPIIGLPGYPVSTYVTYESFVKPILNKLFNNELKNTSTINGIIARKYVSTLKYMEHVRVKVGLVNDKYIITPLSKGAGITMSLVKADGYMIIPREYEGISAGDSVKVELYTDKSKVDNTLVSIGSHDIIMDLLSDRMTLSSSHLGSMGGIMALRNNECHIAPIHLIDSATGEYNISFIRKYFPNKKMAIIKGLKRIQGLMVTKGNPKNIQSVIDLTGDEITYCNRQNGSGTRMLLDYLLKENNINSSEINGYNLELTTHMSVAVSVEAKTVTTGLGVYSAAKALNLEFVSISDEEYDFALHYDTLEDSRVQEFIKILKSSEFEKMVNQLGGYQMHRCGEVVLINA